MSDERFNLDEIEAQITEFSYSGTLRRSYTERLQLAIEITRNTPRLVRELRTSRTRVVELEAGRENYIGFFLELCRVFSVPFNETGEEE